MVIANETRTRLIKLIIVESELIYYPSYRLVISLKTEEFSGNFNRSIWVSAIEVKGFIQQLKKLDETRNGKAVFSSLSPNEFSLTIKNLDDLGHLCACLFLKKNSPLIRDYKDSFSFNFEIDPTSIPYLIKSLSQEIIAQGTPDYT